MSTPRQLMIVLVALQVVVSCGGKAQTASGDDPNAGGVDAGREGGSNVDLPPPPDDSCGRFGIEVSSGPCRGPCPPQPCDGGTTAMLFAGFGSSWCTIGVKADQCLVGLNCALADDVELFNCFQSTPCAADTDCKGGLCVTEAGAAMGECAAGSNGARCRQDDDCRNGRCVATTQAGLRKCSDGAEFAFCNDDTECKSARCARLVDSFVGICTTGAVGHPCFQDAACTAGLFCAATTPSKVPIDLPVRLCSSGKVGEPCAKAEDCVSHHCPAAGDRVCSSGNLGDRCGVAGDCESGFCGPAVNGTSVCTPDGLGKGDGGKGGLDPPLDAGPG